MSEIRIAGRPIGQGHPCFVIAEAGVNHNGRLGLAEQLVEAGAAAGADAIKFQTFRAEEVVTMDAPKANYQKVQTGTAESQFEMLQRLELADTAYSQLAASCRQRQVVFLSTPFDERSADLLDELGMNAFKIPSGEITNLPLLAHVARKGKPVILSTGMSTLREVETAITAIRETGNHALAVLHCVSNYPADAADVNLRAMRTMAEAFDVPVGYSDHTMGIEVALAAVALGACIVEKHLTLDQTLPGPDHKASIEPPAFRALVGGIRIVEAALGHGRKEPALSEANTVAVVRKSLVAACDIPAGTPLSNELLAARRPGTGFAPSMRAALVGRRTRVPISAGKVITVEMLE